VEISQIFRDLKQLSMVDIKSVLKKWDYNKTVSKYKDATNFEIKKEGRN
jgi:hypothetical protein